jgi:flagellar basal-body rod protein FlgG
VKQIRSLVVLALAAACAVPAPVGSAIAPSRDAGEAHEAAWSVEPGSAADAAAARIVDPAVTTLLRAALAVHGAQRRVVVENLANAGTCGWKRRVVRTSTRSFAAADGSVHSMPVVLGVEAEFALGTMQETGRALDFAIDGDGFFAVVMDDGGTGYTRAGSLRANADGKLVDTDGHLLQPEITLPCDTLEIAIDPEGNVHVRTAGSPTCNTMLGQLTLHRFADPSGLRIDGAVLRCTETSGAPMTSTPGACGAGQLKQGCLEGSNVDRVREAFELQMLDRQQRHFDALLRQLGLVAP